RTHTASEFGEVIGQVKPLKRLLPAPVVHQVIPLRNEIVDWTARSHTTHERAGVAKGNTTIHAPPGLLLEMCFVDVFVKFLPILHSLQRRAIRWKLTLKF